MNFEQKIRYARNISLQQIGEVGQEKLLNSNVCVIGAGGLGSPIIKYLAATGIGNITIIDDDKVDISNLQRQIIFNSFDIGDAKAQVAAEAVHDLNCDVKVTFHTQRLDDSNIDDFVRNSDIVIDGSDNIETRLQVNDYCHSNKITLISPAIHQFTGHLYVFKSYLGDDYPCYRCIFPNLEKLQMPKCSESGILGSVGGVMGSLAVTETIKELLEIGDSLAKNMVIYDALSGSFKKLQIKKNRECRVCV